MTNRDMLTTHHIFPGKYRQTFGQFKCLHSAFIALKAVIFEKLMILHIKYHTDQPGSDRQHTSVTSKVVTKIFYLYRLIPTKIYDVPHNSTNNSNIIH